MRLLGLILFCLVLGCMIVGAGWCVWFVLGCMIVGVYGERGWGWVGSKQYMPVPSPCVFSTNNSSISQHLCIMYLKPTAPCAP